MKLLSCLKQKLTPEIRYIIFLFLGTRIALTIIGVLSRIFWNNLATKYSSQLWLDIWGQWDTGWYLNIATQGYSATVSQAASTLGNANYAFFPLYPLMMRFLGYIIGSPFIAGILISNIALIIACIYLYKLMRLKSSKETSLRTIKYLFLFPVAFIFSGVLTESLFLMLLVMCFYYARTNKWALVGIFGFFLSLTRIIGIFAVIPLAYEYLKNINFNFKKIRPAVLYFFLFPLGLSLFLFLNYSLTGDPFAFIKIQSSWFRTFVGPQNAIINALFYQGQYAIEAKFEVWFALVALFILIFFYKKLRISYIILALYSILIPISSWVTSMPRYILTIFPFFIIFALLGKNRKMDIALTIGLTILQGFLMIFWANGTHLII